MPERNLDALPPPFPFSTASALWAELRYGRWRDTAGRVRATGRNESAGCDEEVGGGFVAPLLEVCFV